MSRATSAASAPSGEQSPKREGGRPQTRPNEPNATRPHAAEGGPREQAIENKLAAAQIAFGHFVVRDFPRSLRGYNRAAVRKHLELIAGWLSLSGFDDLVQERFNEKDPLGRRLRSQAETEAEQIRADARRDAGQHTEEARRVLESARQDAEGIRARARREADTLLADARAHAAAERRGALARLLSRGAPDR